MNEFKQWYGYLVTQPDGSQRYIEHRVDAVKQALSVGQTVFYNCLTEQQEIC
jgi:hypothetical protein